MSEDFHANFLKANKVTLDYADKINNYLYGYHTISIIPIVNACCMGLKLDEGTKMLNSNMLIDYAGGGKSTLLKILTASNPKLFVKLDARMYAYELAKDMAGNQEKYRNKILVHDDLIGMFQGLSQKSREQLTFFWTYLLSEGKYAQLGMNIEDMPVMALFGCARDIFMKYRNEFFVSTLGERITMYDAGIVTDEQSKKAIERMEYNKKKKIQFPKIVLPIRKKKKEIEWFDDDETEIAEEIRDLCIDFKRHKVKSAQRAYNYITNFIMSNALLNGRKKMSVYDLALYKIIHPYHVYKPSSKNYAQISIKNNLLLPTNKQKKDDEMIKLLKIPSRSYFEHKSKIIVNISKGRF